MTKFARKLEGLFIEVTFAEDRIFDTVQGVLKGAAQIMEDTFTAIAFAEEGDFQTAKSYINSDGVSSGPRRTGRDIEGFSRPCTGRA